jgi:enoyl-CoA hydratase/carnithine racemase
VEKNLQHIQAEVSAGVGLITLNRPQALNALSLEMLNNLTAVLCNWIEDAEVEIVAIRGTSRQGPFGAFCAGGDIRFFHDAAIAGDSTLEDFFTTEYRLNNLIYNYPKPYIAFMDGVVMGGGMGLAQGAHLRIVGPSTKMAMPETNIGLFPDVGGGYFLSRCPGFSGEYLALTGQVLSGEEALAVGLADGLAAEGCMPDLWHSLTQNTQQKPRERLEALKARLGTTAAKPQWLDRQIDAIFSLPTLVTIIQALEQADNHWAIQTLQALRQRSPLMLHVTLEQIRRGRQLQIADELRLERTLVQHCFNPVHLKRAAYNCETVEGIRALVVDKDRNPQWHPPRIEDVTAEMVIPFFDDPWPQGHHPLADL